MPLRLGCLDGVCACCAPCCRRCQRLVADPSGRCYCRCCSRSAWWWRLCLGKNYYQPTSRNMPNNAIYVPTTAPVLSGDEGDGLGDGDDVAVFSRVPTSQTSYGAASQSQKYKQTTSAEARELVQVSAIGGTHAQVETPSVKYDHIIVAQPAPAAGNNERSPFLPS